MRILFDQGVPLPLKGWFASHHDLFIMTDHNLHHQLDLSRFEIAVLVLMSRIGLHLNHMHQRLPRR
jgi:hypothetical protein